VGKNNERVCMRQVGKEQFSWRTIPVHEEQIGFENKR
jgi:hypothetical protein